MKNIKVLIIGLLVQSIVLNGAVITAERAAALGLQRSGAAAINAGNWRRFSTLTTVKQPSTRIIQTGTGTNELGDYPSEVQNKDQRTLQPSLLQPIDRPFGQPTRGYGSSKVSGSSFYGKGGNKPGTIRSRMNARGFASNSQEYNAPIFYSDDPRKIVGFGPNEVLTEKMINKRRRELAKKLHPDVNQDKKKSSEQMSKVNNACDLLLWELSRNPSYENLSPSYENLSPYNWSKFIYIKNLIKDKIPIKLQGLDIINAEKKVVESNFHPIDYDFSVKIKTKITFSNRAIIEIDGDLIEKADKEEKNLIEKSHQIYKEIMEDYDFINKECKEELKQLGINHLENKSNDIILDLKNEYSKKVIPLLFNGEINKANIYNFIEKNINEKLNSLENLNNFDNFSKYILNPYLYTALLNAYSKNNPNYTINAEITTAADPIDKILNKINTLLIDKKTYKFMKTAKDSTYIWEFYWDYYKQNRNKFELSKGGKIFSPQYTFSYLKNYITAKLEEKNKEEAAKTGNGEFLWNLWKTKR